MRLNICFVCLRLTYHAVFCRTTTIRKTDEERLFEKLFKHYNRASRPVLNASDSVNVEFSVSLIEMMKLVSLFNNPILYILIIYFIANLKIMPLLI